MKKQVLLIALSTISIVSIIGVAAVSKENRSLIHVTANSSNYVVKYVSGDFSIGSYDSGNYKYPGYFLKNYTSTRDGEVYSLQSDVINAELGTGTSIVCSKDSLSFGGDNLFSFVSEGWETFEVTFTLSKLSTLQTGHEYDNMKEVRTGSFVEYHIDGNNTHYFYDFDEYGDTEDGQHYVIYAGGDFYSNYDDTIVFDCLQLSFTC